MRQFSYARAASAAQALEQWKSVPGSRFVSGGTNLLDLMKENLLYPSQLVDVNCVLQGGITPMPHGGLMLGAGVRNAATAWHPLVRERFPVLTAAMLAAASPQIRNMASNGGNLLQRTRCHYFYDAGVPCNKREPGSGCPAIAGLARQHAIIGGSSECIATHPSDMCVALRVLDAVVHVHGVDAGKRTIPFAAFHRLPGTRPDVDTILDSGELVTGIELPEAAEFVKHSSYLKLRERASYAFALVSVAAALDLERDGTVRQMRIALGGVAHKPWRDSSAEQLAVGLRPEEAAARVADALLEGATAYGTGPGSNAFKIPMARRAVVRAVRMAVDGVRSNTGVNGLNAG